jgi:hypothetical protein
VRSAQGGRLSALSALVVTARTARGTVTRQLASIAGLEYLVRRAVPTP